uniref:D-2-hydroxyglutarate dehydrogenase, mitochondrial n=1 Tax=Lygus hesperus TaxID=30085 RepID=A0A146MBK1_LYGHE
MRMAYRMLVRRYSTSPFLTTERYPNSKRGSYGKLGDAQLAAFERILGPNRVLTSEDDVAPYNLDWLKSVCGQGKVVLRPKNTEEVSHVMKICSENKLAVCPQGGNTGLVGGSVPVFDEVVISMSLMNNVNFVDGTSGTVSCQAGVVLEKLEKALEPEGLMASYDLGARGSCQIGGNISTCAGGLRLLRYGSMLANTLGIEAVLADGTILNTMNSLKKDNTGYHLRQLFVGSEGTLGIVTQAVLQCPIRPRSVNLAFLTLKNFSGVLSTFALAKRNLCETLSSCEMMDATSLWYLENKLGLKVPLEHDPNTFFMFIETHGSREDHDEEKMSAFVQDVIDKGFVSDGITTNEPARMSNLWQLRERAAEASCKEDYLYTYDITLPLISFYDAVGVLKQRLAPFGSEAKVSGFGHLGDGNLHLDITSPTYSDRLLNAIEPFIFEWVASVGGSISAEHGMGFKKAKYLKYGKSPEAINLMRRLKNSMDPLGILNPYKVLPPL